MLEADAALDQPGLDHVEDGLAAVPELASILMTSPVSSTLAPTP